MSQTTEDILDMPAGQELDALIAEKVMGFRWVYTEEDVPWMQAGVSELKPPSWIKNADTLEPWLTMEGVEIRHGKGRHQDTNPCCPRYSIDIAAAFEAFAGKGWMLYENLQNDANRWFVFADDRALEDWRPAGWGETAPLAICRALLKSFVR